MKGYRIVKINSMEDLKKADYDWALEQGGVPLEDVIGCYVIIGDEATEFTPTEASPVLVTIITNIDVRMYWERATAYKVSNELWITEEEMERVTT